MKHYEREEQNWDSSRPEKLKTSETSCAQKTVNNVICHFCGNPGHISPEF